MMYHSFTKLFPSIYLFVLVSLCACSTPKSNSTETKHTFNVPEGYMDEAEDIPDFWISTIDEINSYVADHVKRGHVEICGTSAGGRPIISVSYGKGRAGDGSTTFSGSLGASGTAYYRGSDSDKRVYMGLAGVHGFELEGVVGIINLIEIMETGKDLDGKVWPDIHAMLDSLDRIVLLPLVNPDGRDRVPVRMEPYRGGDADSFTVHEYLNTGGKKDGTIIGWPDVKAYIPMDFDTFGFPGGYPNDAGVNMMHDDFFGSPQPEMKALFNLTAKEKPDVILNMHTGVPKNNYFMHLHRPFAELWLQPVFDRLYRQIKTTLAEKGLQGTTDISVEADASAAKMKEYNMSTALNLHSGALSVVIESPSHGYSGTNLAGKPVVQTPRMLLDAQLIAHREALRFLIESGGRTGWEKEFLTK